MNLLIKSAAVLACCTASAAMATPDDGTARPVRLIRPVNILHNEQGDVSPMNESRNGCRQETPWFSGIGHLPDGYESHALGVSADGHYIVGSSTGTDGPSGSGAYLHAIAWTACDGLRTLPGTPAQVSWSIAHSISNTGRHVAGQVYAGFDRAGLWTNRTDGIQSLENPSLGAAQRTSVRSVSADGRVFAGTAEDGSGREAFIYIIDAAQALMLGDLPGGEDSSEAHAISHNANAVVGRSSSNLGTEAFLWTSATGMIALGDLPGGLYESEANAVTSDGTVVVGSGSTEFGRRAFRWTAAGGMQDLGDLAGGYGTSEAFAVSADGAVIVGRASGAFGDEAFIWTERTGMRSLHAATVNRLPADFRNWSLSSVRGISADGTILAGSGLNPSGYVEGWVMELPRGCPADWNADDFVNSSDLFSFLEDFFTGDADFTGDYITNTQDFFEFLNAFFSGC